MSVANVSMDEIRSVAVIGAGAMGSQIAMVCALAGLEVRLHDSDIGGLAKAESALRDRMAAQVAKGRRSADDVAAAFDNLWMTLELSAAVSDVDLVIEAIVEDLTVKQDLFRRLDELCDARTVLASNTSSFVPSRLAEVVERGDRVLNLHFFNPALVMKCVEVVRAPTTSDATMAIAGGFVERIGKDGVVLEREIHGFVANRILNAVRDEAISLLEGGYASVEAIDTACRTALGYPMGPFELMDLTGIDIGFMTKSARHAETGDPAEAPSATVRAKVDAGHLGRKTGRGFYTYDEHGNRVQTTTEVQATTGGED